MKRNSFILGCLSGGVSPAVAYLLKVSTSLGTTMHPLSLYVVAGVFNLLLIRFFYAKGLDRCAQGVLLITFVAVLLLIFIDKLSLV